MADAFKRLQTLSIIIPDTVIIYVQNFVKFASIRNFRERNKQISNQT